MSWATDLSPTPLLQPLYTEYATVAAGAGRGGVPGVGWDREGGWEGYTGTPPDYPPGPIFSLFLVNEPTHGQMKAILDILMRFPR